MTFEYISTSANALNQSATWWRRTGSDGFGGAQWAAPVLLDCRWEDSQVKFHSQLNNEEMVSQAEVYLSQDVGVNDMLMLGDQTGQASPNGLQGASEVQSYAKTTDLASLEIVRKAML